MAMCTSDSDSDTQDSKNFPRLPFQHLRGPSLLQDSSNAQHRGQVSEQEGDISEQEAIAARATRNMAIARDQARSEEIQRLIEICGSEGTPKHTAGTKPLKVIFIGKPGAGKSSLINGVAAALSEDIWREYTLTSERRDGSTITISIKKYQKCCNGDMPRYQKVYLPTLIDLAGLSNDGDVKMEEFLRLLFYGHIQDEMNAKEVYDNVLHSTTSEIRGQYRKCYPDMRVDRVVFVASAADELPENLMAAVYRAARPSDEGGQRDVPIFGVLTKMDLVDIDSVSFQNKEEKFVDVLGLNTTRLYHCKNYCDDLDPQGQRYRQLDPDLDIPYIEFMQKLCDPAREVGRDAETLPGTDRVENAIGQRVVGTFAETLPGVRLGSATGQFPIIWIVIVVIIAIMALMLGAKG